MKSLVSVVVALGLVFSLTGCGDDREDNRDKQRDRPAPNLTDGDSVTPSEPAKFHGYLAMESRLNDRLADPENPLALTIFLAGYRANFVPPLGQLLGYQAGDGLEADFRNGDPNGVNMLLWQLVFNGVANDLASLCSNPESLSLGWQAQGNLRELIQDRLCEWPDPVARNQEALVALWLEIMHYDAPPSEFFAFVDFFLSPDYESATAEEFIHDATMAIFLNPYFLLHN